MKRFILCASALTYLFCFGADVVDGQNIAALVRVSGIALPVVSLKGVACTSNKHQVVVLAYDDEEVRNKTLDAIPDKPGKSLKLERIYSTFKDKLSVQDLGNLENLTFTIALVKFGRGVKLFGPNKPTWRIEMCNATRDTVNEADWQTDKLKVLKSPHEETWYLALNPKLLEVENYLDTPGPKALYAKRADESARTELASIWQAYLEKQELVGIALDMQAVESHFLRNKV